MLAIGKKSVYIYVTEEMKDNVNSPISRASTAESLKQRWENNDELHVIPRTDGWVITRGHSLQTLRKLESKNEAIDCARNMFDKESNSAIVIYDLDGEVEKMIRR